MNNDIPLGPGLSTAAPLSQETRGMLLGLAGVAMFSLTLPFTRMAVSQLGFAHVWVFSVGLSIWYRGMATGGVARVGQVQLVQPFLSVLGAALILGEALEWSTILFALAVIGVVGVGRRMPVRRSIHPS